MTRGKMPLSEVLERGRGAVLCIVGEYHGNPGSLSFYDPAGYPFLSIRISETSFDPVPLAELRYGQRIYYGSKSSTLFNILNRYIDEDEGTVILPDSLTELFKHNKKDPISQNTDVVYAVSWACEGGKRQKPNASYVRRLYVRDDRLDYYSNDRLFLRLYVKGINIQYGC
jgi:hypothetical protein